MARESLPLVSLMIPLGGEDAHVERTLRLALSQAYPQLEVILAGRAGPQAMGIALRYAALDARVRLEPCDLDELEAARRCFELASGDFVQYLWPGDQLAVQAIARLAQPLIDVVGVSLAASKRVHLDRHDAPLPESPATAWPFETDVLVSGIELGDRALRGELNPIGELSGVLFRRGGLAAEHLFALGGDAFRKQAALALWLALLAGGQGAILNEPLCSMRERDGTPGALLEWPRLLKAARASGFLADPVEARKIWVGCARRLAVASRSESAIAAALPEVVAELGEPPVAESPAPITLENQGAKVLCSIVIPAFNKCDYTRRCLEALAEATPHGAYEVIVVDNASTDGTRDLLAACPPPVRVLTNTQNLGFAKACNQGAYAARGRFLVFLNNDTVPLRGWLEGLLGELVDPGVGIVGARLIYPQHGLIQHAGMAFDGARPYHPHIQGDPRAPEVSQARDLDCVTGACLAIPKALFERLGGFDERFENGFEDVDLCLKARELGVRVRYAPESVLYHHESISDGRFAHEPTNFGRYMRRWGAYFDPVGTFCAPGSAAGDARVLWQAPLSRLEPHGLEALAVLPAVLTDPEIALRQADYIEGLEELGSCAALSDAQRRLVGSPYIRVAHFKPLHFQRLPAAEYEIARPIGNAALFPEGWREAYGAVDEIWAPSEFARQRLREAGIAAELRVMPVGIDARRFHPELASRPAPGPRHTIFLTRFDPHPALGWDLLLQAWAKAFQANEPVRLVLGVSQRLAETAPAFAREVARFCRASFGARALAPWEVIPLDERRYPELMAASSAFVAPARFESTGLHELEAMAAGRPVIATAWGAPAAFLNAANGLPVEVSRIEPVGWEPAYEGDRWAVPSLESLVAQLRRVHDAPESLAVIGARARHDALAHRGEASAAAMSGRLKTILATLPQARARAIGAVPEG